MSHIKVKDTRSDCICRYIGDGGIPLCNCITYHLSNDYGVHFGEKYWYAPHLIPESVNSKSFPHGGGFYLNKQNPMIDCRSCKYYCNSDEKYKQLRKEYIQNNYN